jgi:hypothetical protein
MIQPKTGHLHIADHPIEEINNNELRTGNQYRPAAV